jgi:NAD(P)H-dependent flavin oxidoreductase YrpB (nitropropane dioxygenase family)
MGPSLIGEKTGAPVELVVAVSEAGGLGVLGGAGYTVEELREELREIRKLTSRPFGVDVLLPAQTVAAGDAPPESARQIRLRDVLGALPQAHRDWIEKVRSELGLAETEAMISGGTTTSRPHAAVEVCLDERVPLFCAGLGSPGFMVKAAHAAGTKVLGIAGNAKNAARIAQGGADLVVAQGHEAGGHTGRIGSVALWPQAIDAAAPTPILAAGGIGDGRGGAAALAMGCIGVWVGTASHRRRRRSRSRRRRSCAPRTRTPGARRSTPGRRRGRPTTASTTSGTSRASSRCPSRSRSCWPRPSSTC